MRNPEGQVMAIVDPGWRKGGKVIMFGKFTFFVKIVSFAQQ